MAAPLVVLLDACVLYPYALVDFWCTADEAGIIRACWSEEILNEVRRNLVPRLSAEMADRRLAAMRAAFPNASYDAPAELAAQMTCHPKDRHVLAAGITAEAEFLVTFNLSDFPTSSTELHGVDVVSPDILACLLVAENPNAVAAVLAAMAAIRRRPPNTVPALIDILSDRGLATAMAELREHLEHGRPRA